MGGFTENPDASFTPASPGWVREVWRQSEGDAAIPGEIQYDAMIAARRTGDNLNAWKVIAEWARKRALEDARIAVRRCTYVLFEDDRASFPSGEAVDRTEALEAIRELGAN